MRIEKTAQTVFTPLADGTVSTFDDLLFHTCEAYEVDLERADASLREFVTRLAEFKMIRVA